MMTMTMMMMTLVVVMAQFLWQTVLTEGHRQTLCPLTFFCGLHKMKLNERHNSICGHSGNFQITFFRCNLLTFTFDRSPAAQRPRAACCARLVTSMRLDPYHNSERIIIYINCA